MVMVIGSRTVSTSFAPTHPSKSVKKNAPEIEKSTFLEDLKCK